MIRKITPLFIMAMTILMLASCLGSDEDDTTYYDDTAITAFSLGTLNVRHTTKAKDGVTDSTYTTTLTGSNYTFYIDQVQRTIYNTDSLPVGTDASHVLATISAKNSGIVVLHLYDRNGQDSLIYYSSSDSINFRNPVKVRVYNMTASAFREYTVNVNVHQEEGDNFQWHTTSTDLSNVGERKIVFLGDGTYLYGVQNNTTVGYRKSGNSWESLSSSISLDENAYKNMTAFNGYLFTLSGHDIYRTANGTSWDHVASASIKQLIGASAAKIYALTDEGIASSADGITWKNDSIDDSNTLLPEENINFISTASTVNTKTNNLVLIGNRNGKTVVWSKVEDNADEESKEPWAYYTDDEYNRKTLPYLANLQVVEYDGGLLATGGDFTRFYTSPDYGLTWDIDTTYDLPDGAKGTAMPFTLSCDQNNILYFSQSGSGNIITGRLARLGWKKEQTIFR